MNSTYYDCIFLERYTPKSVRYLYISRNVYASMLSVYLHAIPGKVLQLFLQYVFRGGGNLVVKYILHAFVV